MTTRELPMPVSQRLIFSNLSLSITLNHAFQARIILPQLYLPRLLIQYRVSLHKHFPRLLIPQHFVSNLLSPELRLHGRHLRIQFRSSLEISGRFVDV
jgi:hypothetical protein